jgi:hypothetical protein
MIRRVKKPCLLLWLSLCTMGAAAAITAAACNDTPLIQPPPCSPGTCTCEEDPTQPTCKAFNEPTEGGKDPADARPLDAPPGDAGEDVADASSE